MFEMCFSFCSQVSVCSSGKLSRNRLLSSCSTALQFLTDDTSESPTQDAARWDSNFTLTHTHTHTDTDTHTHTHTHTLSLSLSLRSEVSQTDSYQETEVFP